MNLQARQDWLKAVRRSGPRLKLGRLQNELKKLDRHGEQEWEAGLCGVQPFEKIAFRVYNGTETQPPRGLIWDARNDRPVPARPAKKIRRQLRPFAPASLLDPALIRAFSDFIALCPVRGMITESVAEKKGWRQIGWSLPLSSPLPWPLFARLDIAAPFTADSCRLSFLLLDRRVTELVFRDAELWVYFR